MVRGVFDKDMESDCKQLGGFMTTRFQKCYFIADAESSGSIEDGAAVCNAKWTGAAVVYPQTLEEMYLIGDLYNRHTGLIDVPVDLIVSGGEIISRDMQFAVDSDSILHDEDLTCKNQCCITVNISDMKMKFTGCKNSVFRYYLCSKDLL